MTKLHATIIACALLGASVCPSASAQTAELARVARTDARKPQREFMMPSFPEPDQLEALLHQPEDEIDFARTRLTIDRMIDPTIDVEADLKRIDAIVAQIRTMAGPMPSSRNRLQAIKKYLYEAGPWNEYEPYRYDFDDPFGEKTENKLISSYMSRKKGNCISMPLFFIVLGQRLGIDVTASTAPHHIFVKYTDDATHVTHDMEPTSGANFVEEADYQRIFPIPEHAFATRIYFQKLSKKETIALMASSLAEVYFNKGSYEKATVISNIILPVYERHILAIAIKGIAYHRIKNKRCPKREANSPIRALDLSDCEYLSRRSRAWLLYAQELGWQEPNSEQKARYLETVNRAAKLYLN